MLDIEYTLTGDDTTVVNLVRFVEPFPAALAVDLFCQVDWIAVFP